MYFMKTRLLIQHLYVKFTLFPCAVPVEKKIYDVLGFCCLLPSNLDQVKYY